MVLCYLKCFSIIIHFCVLITHYLPFPCLFDPSLVLSLQSSLNFFLLLSSLSFSSIFSSYSVPSILVSSPLSPRSKSSPPPPFLYLTLLLYLIFLPSPVLAPIRHSFSLIYVSQAGGKTWLSQKIFLLHKPNLFLLLYDSVLSGPSSCVCLCKTTRKH